MSGDVNVFGIFSISMSRNPSSKAIQFGRQMASGMMHKHRTPEMLEITDSVAFAAIELKKHNILLLKLIVLKIYILIYDPTEDERQFDRVLMTYIRISENLCPLLNIDLFRLHFRTQNYANIHLSRINHFCLR